MRGTLPNKTESDKVRIKAKRTKKIETWMNVFFEVYSCCFGCSSVLWGGFFIGMQVMSVLEMCVQ